MSPYEMGRAVALPWGDGHAAVKSARAKALAAFVEAWRASYDGQAHLATFYQAVDQFTQGLDAVEYELAALWTGLELTAPDGRTKTVRVLRCHANAAWFASLDGRKQAAVRRWAGAPVADLGIVDIGSLGPDGRMVRIQAAP